MRRLLAVALFVAMALPAGIDSSGATFVAGTANPGVTLSTAADFNTVAVVLANPGSPLRGSVTLTATAESDRGIASIVFESAPAGTNAWSTACTDTVAPYACTFDTTSVSDGLRDVRAVATDNAGYSRSDVAVSRRVDNTGPAVSTTDPGSPLTGTVNVTSTATDAGAGLASVTLQYRTTAGAWTDVCSGGASPLTCAWDTSALTDGLHDLRTLAVDAAGNSSISAPVYDRRVDNTGPTGVTLGAVAAQIQGTVGLTANAADAGSGVANVRFQQAPAGTTTWTDICTDTSSAYTCSFDTTTVADALYDLRALATDVAGNTTASVVQTNRRVDNDAPVVAITSPVNGASVRATINVTGTATDPGGVLTTTLEYRLVGAPTWINLCTDTSSPYSCPLNTTTLAAGSYEFRIQATDNYSHTSTSAIVTATVDNVAPTAVDIAGTNGGTADTLDVGDTLRFGFSEAMAPASIMAGWNGTSTAVRVRVSNAGAADTLDVYDATSTTKLALTAASLALGEDYVANNAVFNATMVKSGTDITITFGTVISGTIKTNARKANMTWTPSTAATDMAGNACTATAFTEPNPKDSDF